MRIDQLEFTRLAPSSMAVLSKNSLAKKLAFVAAAYFVIGKFGLQFALLHKSASAIWPATGLAIASILLWGFRIWPAIFIGAFLVNVTTTGGVLMSLMIATGNTLEAVAGASLTVAYARGRHAFARPRDVVRFWFLGCMVAALIGATIGVTSLCLTGSALWKHFLPLWRTWWLGDAVGGFIGAAVILLWAGKPSVARDRHHLLESAVVFSFIAILGLLVFNNKLLHQSLSVLPALMWAAFRLGRRETALAVLLVAAIGTWGTFRGTGPFVHPSMSINEALLMLQSYVAVLAVTHMTIASVVAERQRAVTRLRATRDELERRVEDRTVLLSTANQALRDEIVERSLLEARLVAAERQRGDSMRDLAASVQGAQEDERQRVARELHDDLGQRLAALKLKMQVFEQELAKNSAPHLERLNQLVGDVDRTIAEVRRLSYNLRPVALDDFGLTVALEMLCKDFEKVYNIKAHLRVEGSVPWSRVGQIDIALYRVAQGALANVAKHSGAHNVWVSMHNNEQVAILSVADDGRGFEVPDLQRTRDSRTGLGLIGMRERAELLGGSFAIKSGTVGGTQVEVLMPIAGGEQGAGQENPR